MPTHFIFLWVSNARQSSNFYLIRECTFVFEICLGIPIIVWQLKTRSFSARMTDWTRSILASYEVPNLPTFIFRWEVITHGS